MGVADCGGVPISRPVGLRREGEAGGLRNIISIAKKQKAFASSKLDVKLDVKFEA